MYRDLPGESQEKRENGITKAWAEILKEPPPHSTSPERCRYPSLLGASNFISQGKNIEVYFNMLIVLMVYTSTIAEDKRMEPNCEYISKHISL
jgi:hypothetical protein